MSDDPAGAEAAAARSTASSSSAATRLSRLSRRAATVLQNGTGLQSGPAAQTGTGLQGSTGPGNGGTVHGGAVGQYGPAGQNGGAVRDGAPTVPGGAQAGNGRVGTAADSATTANLPVIGGPGDSYPADLDPADVNPADVNPAAVARPAAPPAGSAPSAAPAPSAPPSGAGSAARPSVPNAVDQYAALGLGPALAGAATSSGASAATTVSAASVRPGASAAPASGQADAAVPTVRRARGERTPRRARLQIRHFNVWTVFKFSVVLAVALFFVWLIIVAVLYGTLDHLQVIDQINKTVRTIENDSSTKDTVTPRIVFTAAFLIGLLDIVLFIVLTTIGAVVYNLCADLVGGIEVTLAERD